MRAWESGLVTSFVVLDCFPAPWLKQHTTHCPTRASKRLRQSIAASPESGTTPLSVTIALKLRDQNEAENLLIALHTPGNPLFHQFLTTEQFTSRFAPTNADVAKVTAALSRYGLTAARTTATTLTATGLPADMERAFSVSLHSYEVAEQEDVPGYLFHAPLTPATVPAEISELVTAVVGLDNRPRLHPMNRTVSTKVKIAKSVSQIDTPDEPGLWTVTDFADYYDVQPLYKRGVTGAGARLESLRSHPLLRVTRSLIGARSGFPSIRTALKSSTLMVAPERPATLQAPTKPPLMSSSLAESLPGQISLFTKHRVQAREVLMRLLRRLIGIWRKRFL